MTVALIAIAAVAGCVRIDEQARPGPTSSPATSRPVADSAAAGDPARTSSNGWSRQEAPIALSESSETSASFTAMLRDPRGGLLIVGQTRDATGDRATTWYSDDGASWQEEPIAGGAWITPLGAAASDDAVVVWGARGRFEQAVAAGFLRRAGSAEFEPIGLPPALNVSGPLGLAGGPAGFVAVTSGPSNGRNVLEVYTSLDGAAWRQATAVGIDMADRGGRGIERPIPIAVGARTAVVVLPGGTGDGSADGSADGPADGAVGESGIGATARVLVSSDLARFRPLPGGPGDEVDVTGVALDGTDPVVHGSRTATDGPSDGAATGTDRAGDGAGDGGAVTARRWTRRGSAWREDPLRLVAPAPDPTVPTDPAVTDSTDPVATDPVATDPVATDRTDQLTGVDLTVGSPIARGGRWMAPVELRVPGSGRPVYSAARSDDGVAWQPLVTPADQPLDLSAPGPRDRAYFATSRGPTWVLSERSRVLQTTSMIGLPQAHADVQGVAPVAASGSTALLIGTARPARPGEGPILSTAIVTEQAGVLQRRDEIDDFMVSSTADGAQPIAAGTMRVAGTEETDGAPRYVAAIATSGRGRVWTLEEIPLDVDPVNRTVAIRADRRGDTTVALVGVLDGFDGPELARGMAVKVGAGAWAVVSTGLDDGEAIRDVCLDGTSWHRVVATPVGYRVEVSDDALTWRPAWTARAVVDDAECVVVDGRLIVRVIDTAGSARWLTTGADGAVVTFDPIGDPSVEIAFPRASTSTASVRVRVPENTADSLFVLAGRETDVKLAPGIAAQRFSRAIAFSGEFVNGATVWSIVSDQGRIDAWRATLAALEAVGELTGFREPPTDPPPTDPAATDPAATDPAATDPAATGDDLTGDDLTGDDVVVPGGGSG
jgi:hypothetical protein